MYGLFPEEDAQPLPVICYWEDESNNFYADGVVYYAQDAVQVGLYIKLRNFLTERKVRNALKDIGWEKSISYLSKQRCYEILYEIEV